MMKNPTLRFTQDNGCAFPDWQDSNLGELCEITTGNSNVNENLEAGKYRFFDRGIDSEHYLDTYFLDKEAIIYAGEGASFYPKYYKGKFALHQRCYALFDFVNANGAFLYQYLNTCNKHFIATAVGSTVKSLRRNCFTSCPVKLPCLEEQQKIAAFFTALDEKILLSEQKLNLISKFKNGVLQKIFAQELRFQSYNKPWKEKNTLSQIAIVTMGQSPSSNSYNEDYEGLPLIQGNADIVDGFTKPQRYTTEVIKRCQEGDVILSVRAPVGELGIASEESCIGRGVCAIRANDKSNTAFIYHFLQAKKKQWKTLEQGSTFTAISGEDIKTFEVVVPAKEEQQKIAAFLTAFDKKIDIEKKKLNELHRLKKAFMQKMFI